MIRRVPLAVALCAAIAGAVASGALGAATPYPEPPAAGPPACSALPTAATTAKLGGRAVELWVQCNYRVEKLRFVVKNRPLAAVQATPALYSPEAGDNLACRRKSTSQGVCSGSFGPGVRARVRFKVGKEAICKGAQLRLLVITFGSPNCTGICPAVAFENQTPTPVGRSLGCG